MARTALTPITSARAGAALTYIPAITDGHFVANPSERFMLLIKNDGASPVTVTIPITATVDGKSVSPLEVSVAAGATVAIGPFPKDIYNQVDGSVWVNYSATASVTVAALLLGSAAY